MVEINVPFTAPARALDFAYKLEKYLLQGGELAFIVNRSSSGRLYYRVYSNQINEEVEKDSDVMMMMYDELTK